MIKLDDKSLLSDTGDIVNEFSIFAEENMQKQRVYGRSLWMTDSYEHNDYESWGACVLGGGKLINLQQTYFL